MTTAHHDFVPTRRSLLSRLRKWDDEASWQDFFNTYSKLIYTFAIKAGLSDAEAQDVVQETILTVAKRIPEFKYDPKLGSFKGWLFTITRWRIADQIRKRMPAQASGTDPEGGDRRTHAIENIPDPGNTGLETLWDAEWEKAVVDIVTDRVKSKTSSKQYQIFDLYVLKGWPVEKVCRTLQVSATQVYIAKHRISGLMKTEAKRLLKKPL